MLSSPMTASVLHLAGPALGLAAVAYTLLAWLVVRTRRLRPIATEVPPAQPGVTVLKPLCGAEPTLYPCLRSFCAQAYPQLQIICGVRDAADPAVAVVRRLQAEYPTLALELVVDPRQHGSSLKVSNLINMMRVARHDILLIADADVRVGPGYLQRVVGKLADPAVGLVTCAYRGEPAADAASVLLASFVNDWFMPSVYVAAALGPSVFVSGATIALRRRTLEAFGGFAAIADQLADDYRLGELTRGLGLRIVLAEDMVTTCIHERSVQDLLRHELRWLRTIRTVQPLGYACSFVTFGPAVALLGCALAGGTPLAVALLGLNVAARVLLHFEVRRDTAIPLSLWVLLINDLLGLVLWGWSFASRRVHWRERQYRVSRDGSVQPLV